MQTILHKLHKTPHGKLKINGS